MYTCWSSTCYVHSLVGLGSGGSQSVTNHYLNTMASKHSNKRFRDNDQDTDSDSDNERFSNSNTNWPRFLVVKSSSDDLPLSKLLPFAI